MASKWTLRSKIIALGLGAAVIPAVLLTASVMWKNWQLQSQVRLELDHQAEARLAAVGKQIYGLCQTQTETYLHLMKNNLSIADDVLKRQGGISFLPEQVDWDAVDQFTKASQKIPLPKLAVGQTWLGQNRNPEVYTKLVDDVAKLVGGTCTVFQRMNPQGDMLRIATNVLKEDKTRAIGTFIPAKQADGRINPTISSIMQGKSYLGRAFVVNAWYTTAYKPLQDAGGNIVGMLYVGIKQNEMPGYQSLRGSILATKIGESGYAFVLGGTGPQKGQYLISKDGQRDGENIWEQKDAQGNFLIQTIIKAGLEKKNEVFLHKYPWQNPGETRARMKMAAVTYFEPWDWVIGASAYIDEIEAASNRMNAAFSGLFWHLAIICLAAVGITGLMAAFLGNALSKPLHRSINGLNAIAEHVTSASLKVSSSSQFLAEGSSQQAAALEETTSSLQEMSSMTRSNAESARQADILMEETARVVATAQSSMGRLTGSMKEVSAASEETAKIVKTIDEVAFQTNLLALNAAVEAARAGDAGAGFAVVADEVRNLALRAAEAARNTSNLIDTTVSKVKEGSDVVEKTAQAFTQVAGSTTKVKELVAEIAAASGEQAQGVDQINTAGEEMNGVTQRVAAGAEENAGASEELMGQSEQLKAVVGDLVALVAAKGRKSPG